MRDVATLSMNSREEHKLLNVPLGNGQMANFVRVPECNSLSRLFANDISSKLTNMIARAMVPTNRKKRKRTFLQMTNHDFPVETETDAVLALLVVLGHKNSDQFKQAAKILGHSLGEQMDEVATFAMWASANIN